MPEHARCRGGRVEIRGPGAGRCRCSRSQPSSRCNHRPGSRQEPETWCHGKCLFHCTSHDGSGGSVNVRQSLHTISREGRNSRPACHARFRGALCRMCRFIPSTRYRTGHSSSVRYSGRPWCGYLHLRSPDRGRRSTHLTGRLLLFHNPYADGVPH